MLLYVFLLVMLPFCVGMTPTYVLFGLGRVTTTGTVMLVRGLAGLLLALAYVQWVDQNLTGAVLCMLGVQNSGGSFWIDFQARCTSRSLPGKAKKSKSRISSAGTWSGTGATPPFILSPRSGSSQ